MKRFRVYGASSPGESRRELEHRSLARRTTGEGIVLLQNDGALPMEPRKIALYGSGARLTVKGGSGSGDVHERYSVTVEQGLLNAGFTLATTGWLDRAERQYREALDVWRTEIDAIAKRYSPIGTMKMFIAIGEHPKPQPECPPILPEDLTDETDTAFYVLSRQAGEGSDRQLVKGQYYLSHVEEESLRILSGHYKTLVLVLNCGSAVDLSILDQVRIDAVVYLSQAGMEGGNALADIITGRVNPSGRLTDTWARRYEDYPSAETYGGLSGDLSHNDYFEGVYVGYRWFEVKNIRPRYAFGHGLSYTEFSQRLTDVKIDGVIIQACIKVRNVGERYSGRHSVLLYLRYPMDPARRLVAFGKTCALAPGESEKLKLRFDLSREGVFQGEKGQFELPSGEYGLYLGNKPAAVLLLEQTAVTEKVSHICQRRHEFQDFAPPPAAPGYDRGLPRFKMDGGSVQTVVHSYTAPEPALLPRAKEALNRLNENDLIELVVGGGYDQFAYNRVSGACGNTATKLIRKGIPNIVMSDGPGGVNVNQTASFTHGGIPCYPNGLPEDWQRGWLKHVGGLLKGPKSARTVYHYMSAFPCATLQAQSFDVPLLEEIGSAVGREMEEIGVTVWLAPAMNIHRNPLCGRNFEYYSEDPLVSGKMAAAVVRGVQSHRGCFAAIKHFCCNNQEDNRTGMSSELSERALREIYLRGFRIAVEEGGPGAVMTSYNMVNGTYAPNSYDLCTTVLRCEWGFKGLVMSDWNATDQCDHAKAINAGNDLIMPGNGAVRKKLREALKAGRLERAALVRSASRVLNLIFGAATAEGF